MKKNKFLFFCVVSLFALSCSSNRGASKDAPEYEQLIDAENFKPSRHVEIVLDSSGSMGAEVKDERRIDTAKRMLSLLMKTLQEEKAAVSLTAFGHRKGGSCRDIERLTDMSFKTAEEIDKILEPINPVFNGMTPIARTLREAYERLKDIEGPKSIIMLTDGEESCRGDPCRVAKELQSKLDVNVYNVIYAPESVEEFRSLDCLEENLIAETPEELFEKLADLKEAIDEDYQNKMEGLASIQTLRVLGPQQDAWATAKDKATGQQIRFLARMGTTLPVGTYEVEVHYEPPVIFNEVELKEKDKKTLTVSGEGSLVLDLDFPGLELEAANMLDSKKYRVMAAEDARVPVGRYNIYGMTASGLAFQWLDEIVTPEARVSLALPNWALLEIKTDQPVTFDLFKFEDAQDVKTVSRASFKSSVRAVKQYQDSLGFYTSNAPHIVEPGDYTVVLSNGKKIDRIQISKGEKIVEIIR